MKDCTLIRKKERKKRLYTDQKGRKKRLNDSILIRKKERKEWRKEAFSTDQDGREDFILFRRT